MHIRPIAGRVSCAQPYMSRSFAVDLVGNWLEGPCCLADDHLRAPNGRKCEACMMPGALDTPVKQELASLKSARSSLLYEKSAEARETNSTP